MNLVGGDAKLEVLVLYFLSVPQWPCQSLEESAYYGPCTEQDQSAQPSGQAAFI